MRIERKPSVKMPSTNKENMHLNVTNRVKGEKVQSRKTANKKTELELLKTDWERNEVKKNSKVLYFFVVKRRSFWIGFA